MTDNRGDAHSDQQVELWQREMTRDIHSLQQQVRSRGTDDNASSQVAALARDLHELWVWLAVLGCFFNSAIFLANTYTWLREHDVR